MENLTVDDVYGIALYEAAADLGKVEEFSEAASAIASLFKSEPDFFMLLRMPSLPPSTRKDLVRTVFEGRVPHELVNFLYVLIGKRRIGQFAGIIRSFEKRKGVREGVSVGTIESAVELSGAQLAKFETETGRLLGTTVRLEPKIEASLIGGVRIYVDGKLIDASIRRRLDELKEKMLFR
ncbi:MAG: ATP synthase F1 subunit delta [Clostridiales Family XIII bacterium]|nr:ATP synthase F1 subunit delta [Clostridiales Family XIII bacterium]